MQGDEPLVYPEMIESAVKPLLEDKSVSAVNLVKKTGASEAKNIHEVKVVFDKNKATIFIKGTDTIKIHG